MTAWEIQTRFSLYTRTGPKRRFKKIYVKRVSGQIVQIKTRKTRISAAKRPVLVVDQTEKPKNTEKRRILVNSWTGTLGI